MKCKPFFAIIPIGLFFGIGFLIMLLWNNLLPELFKLPFISYWQAMGLLLLSRLLVGNWSFGAKRSMRFNNNRKKWLQMTDEERQQIKEEWTKRCD